MHQGFFHRKILLLWSNLKCYCTSLTRFLNKLYFYSSLNSTPWISEIYATRFSWKYQNKFYLHHHIKEEQLNVNKIHYSVWANCTESLWNHKMFKIWRPMNLSVVQVKWIVRRNPTKSVSHPRNEMCSLPIGLIWSLKAFHPPSFSIHKPASSDMTANVESTTAWMMSGWPALTQSAAMAEEIVKKLMIFPQLTSLCLNKERPILSTITGAATGGTVSEMLQKVRGWSRSSSSDIRLIITIVWRSEELGRTSIRIETFLVVSPSRFSFSLMNCAQRHWILRKQEEIFRNWYHKT